ncbi:unnamed protein product [Citrullus colocynthis]|uniref:Uncharacterized protein n=1 Tax=Citrullus colocynthis TaxID=252529 RepID=A0ABP0Z6M5_9ROSI
MGNASNSSRIRSNKELHLNKQYHYEDQNQILISRSCWTDSENLRKRQRIWATWRWSAVSGIVAAELGTGDGGAGGRRRQSCKQTGWGGESR